MNRILKKRLIVQAAVLIAVAAALMLVPAVLPAGHGGAECSFAQVTYKANCTSYSTTYGGETNSSDDDDIDLSQKYMMSGSTFVIKIRVHRDGENLADARPVRSDFAWEQTGGGKVTETNSTDTSLTYKFKCTTIGDITLTFKKKDGTWSESRSFRIHPKEGQVPDLYIRGKKSLEESYGGGWIRFYCDDEDNLSKIRKKIRVVSSNKKVAVPGAITTSEEELLGSEEGFFIPITVKKAGKVTISIVDVKYGEVLDSVTLTITEELARKTWEYSVGLDSDTVNYGTNDLRISGKEGDKAVISFAGKKWTKRIPASGMLDFRKLPQKKIGTKGKVTIYQKEGKYKRSFGFKVSGYVNLFVRTKKFSKGKLPIDVEYVGKGDVIKVKVGKKVYSRKVNKPTKTGYSKYEGVWNVYSYTQKIGTQKKGTKVTVTVYNKYKQVRDKTTVTL